MRAVRLLLRGRPPWRRALFQAAARSDARAFAFSYRISRAVKLPCFSSSLSFFWLTSQFPKSKLFSELVLPGFRAREPPFLSGFSQGFAPLSFTVFSSPNTLSPINPFPSGLCLFLFPTLLSLSFLVVRAMPTVLGRIDAYVSVVSARAPHRSCGIFCPSSFQISNLSLKVWGAGFPLLIFDTQLSERTFGTSTLFPLSFSTDLRPGFFPASVLRFPALISLVAS